MSKEIKTPNVVDIEWARSEMERTGKKFCNKDFVYYVTRANKVIDWMDLSKLPRREYNKKFFINWVDVNHDILVSYKEVKCLLKITQDGKCNSNYSINVVNYDNNRSVTMITSSLLKISLGYLFREWVEEYQYLKDYFPNNWEETKRIPINGHTNVYPLCPVCKTVKKIRIRRLFKEGLGCCSINKSAGETYLKYVLLQSNEKFEEQKTFNDCRNERKLPFDFYLPDRNILIEIQGIQHKEPTFGEESYKNTKNNDQIKKKYCKNKGITLIELNYISFDFQELNKEIRRKIDFLNINYKIFDFGAICREIERHFDLEEIEDDRLHGMSYAKIAEKHNTTAEVIVGLMKKTGSYKKRNYVKIDIKELKKLYIDDNLKVKEVANILGVSSSTVSVKIRESGMQKGVIGGYNNKKIRCLNNGKEFNSISIACEWAGLKSTSKIGESCKKENKSAGKHPETGEKLYWEYME